MIPVTLIDAKEKALIWEGSVHALPITGSFITFHKWVTTEGDEPKSQEHVYQVAGYHFTIDSRLGYDFNPVQVNCIEMDMATGKPKQALVQPVSNVIQHKPN